MTQIKSHPNAHILAQLAEISKTDPQPWKRLEMKTTAGDWISCDYTGDPLLNPKVTFRIKPANVNIGGVELEGPLREAQELKTRLWLLFDPTTTPDASLLFYPRHPEHIQWLHEGRLFASKEARDKYQEALVKLANGETK